MTKNDTFKLIIKTPEEEVFCGEVDSVYLTTETGDMMLMPLYAAFSASITYSPIIIIQNEKKTDYVARRGLVFFSNVKNECHILCQQAELKDRVDYDGLKSYLKLIENHISKGDGLSDVHMRFLQDQKLALVQEIEAKESSN